VHKELEELDPDALAERAEAALVAYPHGAAAPVVQALRERGLPVVDLSADFRLDRERYERYYQAHTAPALIDEAVYGLTELPRDLHTAPRAPRPGPAGELLCDAGARGHARRGARAVPERLRRGAVHRARRRAPGGARRPRHQHLPDPRHGRAGHRPGARLRGD